LPPYNSKMRSVLIQLADPASADVSILLQQLDAYLESLYPAESNFLLSIDALKQPQVTLLTATVEGVVAGCGAYVNHGEYIEIKRMYVRPEFRGLKIGRRLLDALETRARAAGLRVARLETGVSQPQALNLYEKAGYKPRGPFGDYPADPLCVFMEKSLG